MLGLLLGLLVIVAVTDQDLSGVDEGDSEGLTDAEGDAEGLTDEDVDADAEVVIVGVTVRVLDAVGVIVTDCETD